MSLFPRPSRPRRQRSKELQMRRPSSRMGLILLGAAIAVVALAATAAAQTRSAHASPIIIGWAYDGSKSGPMAPFDGPALAAAKLRVAQVNAKGGVGGRPLQIVTCNTQGDKAAISK